MNITEQQLIESLITLYKKEKVSLYDPKVFKTLLNNNFPKRPTGDIFNMGDYIWKIESFSQLIKDLQPLNILEIGFNVGTSSIMFLRQAEKFFDFPISLYSCEKMHHREHVKKAVNFIENHFSNFNFIPGDSTEVLDKYLSKNEIKIDFAFIDGDHSHKGAYNDVNIVQPYIKEGGMIFIDDWYNCPAVRGGALEANWEGWSRFEVPKYENGAYIFLKNKPKTQNINWIDKFSDNDKKIFEKILNTNNPKISKRKKSSYE